MKGNKAHKRNILAILLLTALSALAAGLLASCAIPDNEQVIIGNGYVHLVTYDANGGDFDVQRAGLQETITARVMDNSLTVEPGYVPSGSGELDRINEPTRSDAEFVRWDLVEYDEEGQELSRRPWDFLTDRVTSDITLEAVWQRYPLLHFYAMIDGQSVSLGRELRATQGANFFGRLYQNTEGENVTSPANIRTNFSTFTVNDTEYTALGFYWMDGQTRVDITAENAVFSADAMDMTIYAEVIEGEFTMVTQDNASRLTLSSNSQWYLLEDIDLGQSYPQGSISDYSSAAHWTGLTSFEGKIYGNGHTISNVWVTSAVQTSNQSLYYSVFGVMNGEVRDVTFENLEFTVYSDYYTGPGLDIQVALLAGNFGASGIFEAVSLDNCSVSIVNSYVPEISPRPHFTYTLAQDNGLYWVDAGQNASTVTGSVTVREDIEDGNIDYIR